jgi:hypothetical protein
MRFWAFSNPNRRRRELMITRQSEKLQPSLFDEDEPRVVLATAQIIDLAVLMKALLREIATALANREIGDEQDRPSRRHCVIWAFL